MKKVFSINSDEQEEFKQELINYANMMIKQGKGLKLITNDGAEIYRVPCPCCQADQIDIPSKFVTEIPTDEPIS